MTRDPQPEALKPGVTRTSRTSQQGHVTAPLSFVSSGSSPLSSNSLFGYSGKGGVHDLQVKLLDIL